MGQGEVPGQIFQILESFISFTDDVELGGQISQAVKSWSPVDVARKIVTGSSTALFDFLGTSLQLWEFV
ncbi:hypothetical protein GH714_010321 [Hevea brasiliensis]|uniref:Uncharacterized protein n=1 Tax=Hevea brasiliensis TaxID=3981 RepID=A0A6A6L9A6_HEVBR|nr:hypothetical protein GH714_010321 [Hevea brasiliensis]